MNKAIVYLKELTKAGDCQFFPVDSDFHESFVIRLKGPLYNGLKFDNTTDDELVAFHKRCTHLGWDLHPAQGENTHHVIGPCPGHLTSFDLSKGGMVVIGQATECLPQVKLKLITIDNRNAIEASGFYLDNSVPYGLVYGQQTDK